ncbi:DUF4350 domain-containing protein [Caulobacter sp. 17J80-11]|uniref:DUF4350 domain-containing protein n=1 Tax=Caulobacter sp. 17J80-11 TaxID=2763502 RepID=UPI0016535CF3|nr:DUF4350 domain-containing protein [Caulobacter sp. 17J80-11]MBC6981882.1 hypothetical protein [Caulobacter sp. 17J80-11]
MSEAVLNTPAAGARRGAFSPVTVLWLVLVGVFTLSALGVLSAYAPDLRKGDDGGAHALSTSAVGYAGAVKMLRLRGQPVVVSRGALPDDAEGLLILTPTEAHDAKALNEIDYDGTVLVVLPKWRTAPEPLHRGWVRAVEKIDPGVLTKRLLKDLAPGSKVERRKGKARPRLGETGQALGAPLGEIEDLQTLSGAGWAPVLVDETGRAVLARQKNGGVYVLADPDLLNTHGLRDLATAREAMAMIDYLRAGDGGPVVFDATLHGFKRPRSVLRLALEPPFLGVTLCALAVALLVSLQAFARFGPVRVAGRSLALGKQALADNTAALIRMAGREHRMAAPYALLIRAAVVRAVGAPRNLSGDELDAFLDRLSKLGGASHGYTELAGEARAARTPADLMRVARKLHLWRLEMTRERR